MATRNLLSNFSTQTVYLHQNFQNFYEIILDPTTNNVTIRHGQLISQTEEDQTSIKNEIVENSSLEEAIRCSEQLANQKLSEGYNVFEKSNSNLNSLEISSSVGHNECSENQSQISLGSGLKRKAKEPLVREDLKQGKKCEGGVNSAMKDSTLSGQKSRISSKFVSFFKNFVTPKKKEDEYIQKVYIISEKLMKYADALERKCVEIGLTYNLNEDNLTLSGEIEKISQVEEYIKQSETELANLLKKEVKVSAYLVHIKDTIVKKAEQFNLSCEFLGQRMVVQGETFEDMEELFSYLIELEASPEKLRFEKRDIEELAERNLQMNKSIQSDLEDVKNIVSNFGMQIEKSSAKAAQEEIQMMNVIQNSLINIQKGVESLESRKAFDDEEYTQREVKGNEAIHSQLLEINHKLETLDQALQKNPEQCLQLESSLIQPLVTTITKIEQDIDFLTNKVEENSGLIQNKISCSEGIQHQVLGMSQKLTSLESKISLKDENVCNNEKDLKDITNRIELMEKKLAHQVPYLDLDKKFVELMKYFDERLKSKPVDLYQTEENKGEITQREVGISTFLRLSGKEVKRKAEELGVIVDLAHDMILVSGFSDKVDKFIVYLNELEFIKKKKLYPKWWNFHEVRAFSLTNVSSTNEEFREITQSFIYAMPNHTIVKLEKIQNKFLMDHYLSKLQLIQELRPHEQLRRQLLYYGTSNGKPEMIYQSPDTGFEVQSADNATSGGYGKGLRFFTNPSNCHASCAYKTQNGTYQMIIADVFIGKSSILPPGDYLKAPFGSDSISANGFYLIYNNFHSCPLYVIEYK